MKGSKTMKWLIVIVAILVIRGLYPLITNLFFSASSKRSIELDPVWELSQESSGLNVDNTPFSFSKKSCLLKTKDSLTSISILDGKTLWSIPLDPTSFVISDSLSSEKDVNFILSRDKLICINSETGEELWNYQGHITFRANPLYAYDEKYFVTIIDKSLCLFNKTEGLIWKKGLNNPSPIHSIKMDHEIIVHFFPSASKKWGTDFIYNMEGELVYQPKGNDQVKISLGEGTLLLYNDEVSYAYNYMEQKKLWERSLQGSISVQVETKSGSILVGKRSVLNASDGEIIKEVSEHSNYVGKHKDLLFFSSSVEGKVHAVDVNTFVVSSWNLSSNFFRMISKDLPNKVIFMYSDGAFNVFGRSLFIIDLATMKTESIPMGNIPTNKVSAIDEETVMIEDMTLLGLYKIYK